MKPTYVEDGNPEELTIFARAYRGATITLTYRILESIPRETRLVMIDLQENHSWRMGLETLVDKFGQIAISLVGVAPGGERRVFAEVAEGSPKNAH